MVKHHGWVTTTKILKDLHSRTQLRVIGQRVLKEPYGGVWLKTSPCGLPKRLPILREVVISNPREVTFVTNLVRLITLSPSTDIRTITDPLSVGWPPSWLGEYEQFVHKHLKQDEVKLCDWHTTTKSGPNGPAAIVSSGIDALALARSLITDWQFRESCLKTGNIHVLDRYDKFIKSTQGMDLKDLKWPKQITNARLAYLSDKAGKTRVVYILNYWIQELLKPLHDVMFKWLRKQPQDGTFVQSKAVETVRLWTEQGKPCYCYDLTAATDRWPKAHQAIAIKALAGQTWLEVWDWCLGIDPYSQPHSKWVCYNVGQPMGAYASWAALAISHHMLIRFCISRVKSSWDCYVVLGDDVVISDSKVAKEYKTLLSSLGVTISQGKSVLPELQENGCGAEFAKQILFQGKDYTPISPKLLFEIYEQYQWYKFLELLQWCQERYGWEILSTTDSILLPSPLKDLWNIWNPNIQRKLRILLGYPDLPFPRVKAIEETDLGDEYFSIGENPWKGYSSMTYNLTKLHLITEELSNKAHELITLRESLKGEGRGNSLPGWLLEVPEHPIWAVLDRLDSSIQKVCSSLDRGDLEDSREYEDVSMDADFLKNLLINGVSYNEWKDKKSRRLKIMASRVFKLHHGTFNPEDMGEDLSFDHW